MRTSTKSWLLAAALAALLAIGAACGSDNAEVADSSDVGQSPEIATGHTDVSPQELNSMLENKDFVFVNVHIPYEGEIADTDLFLPYDEIADRLEELPAQREAKIVLYCRSGGMSAIASTTLTDVGYTNVWNLDGGMVGWEAAGFPLVDARS